MRKAVFITIFSLLIISCANKKKKEPENEIKTELNKKTQNLELKKEEFLKSKIFFGLKNLNDGFDSESIYYFTESDFEIVLNRVKKNGIGIYGIEPWLNGDFYNVRVHEQLNAEPNDPKWYREAFSEFKKRGKNLQYSATYEIPNELIVE
ncbi:hypothetical protein [Nonlabens arenilitoris]|uniref:hypothetical protein n=1 Tax=Nonlabens arenilitoris TaxID=1217969 RepID=UPI000CF57EFC|nr:hypothetical protein [Nonlabens arenilitoris]